METIVLDLPQFSAIHAVPKFPTHILVYSDGTYQLGYDSRIADRLAKDPKCILAKAIIVNRKTGEEKIVNVYSSTIQ